MAKKGKPPQTPAEAISETIRFYGNAKKLLSQVPIGHGVYKDKDSKGVREACAMGYLAVNFAIDSYLMKRGKMPSQLPASFNEYIHAIKRVPHNGKLLDSFIVVYQNLHVLGYYRGGIDVEMIKSGFNHAKSMIDTFSKL